MARKRYHSLDDAEFSQDICACLLDIFREGEIIPYKVASQIAGRFKNRMRCLINGIIRKDRYELAWDMDERSGARE